MKFETLKRPSQFKRVRGGVRWAGPLFVMEGRRRSDTDHQTAGLVTPKGPRFGFTITRKVGGAVVRNRIRRRLKEAIRALSSPLMRADHDYVVVARRVAHDYPFAGLQDALREAFERLHQQAVGGQRPVTQGKRPADRREAVRPALKGVVEVVQSAGAEVRQPAPDPHDDTRPGTAPGRR